MTSIDLEVLQSILFLFKSAANEMQNIANRELLAFIPFLGIPRV